MKPMEFAKRAAADKLVDYLLENPEENMGKIMDKLNALLPEALFSSQREAFTHAIEDQSNWYQLLMRVAKLNPEVAGSLIKAFLVESNLLVWDKQEKMREKHRCNIPWAILLDPTSACNLHCTGCWAAEYGHNLNLSFDDIDSIICQGKELGVHVYIYTGGGASRPQARFDQAMREASRLRVFVFSRTRPSSMRGSAKTLSA